MLAREPEMHKRDWRLDQRLQARLDRRTGGRVLCGLARCDGQLAKLFEIGVVGVDGPKDVRVLGYVSPGFVLRESGIWELTRHASRLVSQGKRPLHRRPAERNIFDELDTPCERFAARRSDARIDQCVENLAFGDAESGHRGDRYVSEQVGVAAGRDSP